MMNVTRVVLAALALSSPLAAPSGDEPARFLLQKPTVSRTHVAFSFAGDLWIVGREGGEARRLTNGVGPRDGALLLSRRLPGRFHRRVRRQRGRLRGRGERRRAPAPHLAPGRGPRRRAGPPTARPFSSGRGARASTSSTASSPCPSPAASRRSCRCPGPSRGASPPTESGWPTCRSTSGSRPGSATAAGRRRPSGSPTSPTPGSRPCPATNSNDSSPVWLGDRVYFLSDRNGPRGAVRLRHEDEAGQRGREERRARLQVADRRARRPRLRAVRLALPLRSRHRSLDAARHTALRRLPGGAPAVREGGQEARGARPVPERQAGRVRGAGRDPHRPRREGRHPEPDPLAGGGRPRPGLVARRAEARLALGRVRRVRPARPRPGRPRRGEEDRPRPAAVLLLPPALFPGREEDRPRRQAPERLDRRPREARAARSRRTPTRSRSRSPSGRPTRAGSPTRRSCPASSPPCSSTRSTPARRPGSPTA